MASLRTPFSYLAVVALAAATPAFAGDDVELMQVTAASGSDASAATLQAGGLRSRCNNQRGDVNVTAPFKELVFIHIPRAGGTSIEDCSRKEVPALRWGSLNERVHGLGFTAKGFNQCFKQHMPPSMLPDAYEGTETFCVVRHPFEKAISQFGFEHTFFPKDWACTPHDLNRYLLERVNKSRSDPYAFDCHLMPQTAFVYGWNNKTHQADPSGSSCKHMLRFEKLYEDFNALMESHGYPYRMDKRGQSISTKSSDECHKLTPANFTPEVRRLLLEVYADDFKLLQYSAP